MNYPSKKWPLCGGPPLFHSEDTFVFLYLSLSVIFKSRLFPISLFHGASYSRFITSGSPYKTNSLTITSWANLFHCVISSGCLPFNFWSEDQI